MRCHGCMITLNGNEYLKCNSCNSEYCFACLNLSPDALSKLHPKQLAGLSCPYCQNVTKRRNDDDTPIRQRRKAKSFNESLDMSLEQAPTCSQRSIASSSPTGANLMNGPVTMESISKLFDLKLAPDSAIMMNLRSALKKDVEKMVDARIEQVVEQIKVDFTATTDFLSAEQKDLKSEIHEKDSRITRLETELAQSKNSLSKLETRMSTMEKVSRNLNVEIHEVPESKNENLMILFKKLCECLQVVIPDGDIGACRRVAKMDTSSKRPRNILVTLSSQRLRDLLISAVTRYNKAHPNDKLASTHIGFTGETRRIYISEHLSPETKELHRTARKFCRDQNYKFVWVRFGQIYIRKDEKNPAIHVKNNDTLNKLH